MRPMTVMLAALILFVPNQIHFPTSLGAPGLNVFNLMFLTAFLLLAMQSASGNRGADAPATAVPKPPLTNILLTFYAILGIALVNGVLGGTHDLMLDLTIYKTVVSYSMLYFLAYYGVRDTRTVRLLIVLVVFVFAVAALEAIKEGLTYGFGNYNEERRAAGPFGHGSGNSNYAGVFYGMFSSVCLAITLLGKSQPLVLRVVALGCYGLGCIAIFATYSRQSLLIIGVTTLLLALRRSPLLAGVAVMCMLSYPLWAPEGIVERVEMTTEESPSPDLELEYSAASRYELWGGAWEIMKKNPLGVGFNQFKDEIEPYLPDWVTARDAQNQYLLIGAEAGFLGMLIFLLLIAGLFRIGLRLLRIKESPDAQMLGNMMCIAVVAMIMGNIYSSTFFSGEVMGNFWMFAGLLSRYTLLVSQESPAANRAQGAADRLEEARQVYVRWHNRRAREKAER